MPVSYATDFDMLTDESFSRIFFYGLGSVLMAKQQHVSRSEYGPFLVDIPLQDLKLRDDEKFRPLGARIHFSREQMVTAIHDHANNKTFVPGDEGWEEAKMLARCSAFLLVTAREHLTWAVSDCCCCICVVTTNQCVVHQMVFVELERLLTHTLFSFSLQPIFQHLLVSNAATREKTIHLNPDHPIRRLLTVFTFGATEVNVNAFSSLVPDACILHRATALEYSSMTQLFEMAYSDSVAFEPFGDKQYNPELQTLIDNGLFPYASEGKEYYDIVLSFVKKWLKEAGDAASDEQARAFYDAIRTSTNGQKYELPSMDKEKHAMAKLLATIIFTVTADHELVGHVVDYTTNPSGGHARISKNNPLEVDLQSYLYAATVTASTSRKMPALMGEFKNFFGVDGPDWERTHWDSFQGKLKKQSKKVREADKARKVEFKYFDPAHFECSISV